MYQKELMALKRANRYRERRVFQRELLDFASNDYLGFSQDRELLELAYREVSNYGEFSPKASLLVNGYSKIHKDFEDRLIESNGFEDAIVLGSGFLANISLIESLIRRGDRLLIDSEYHASGVLATELTKGKVHFFKHNDLIELESELKKSQNFKRVFIAIEGIYSMSGDLAKFEIFELAKKYGATLIVDEAHSSGVIGKNLQGIFELYSIEPTENHIKMGTLGKAYGSYGAYILASNEIVEFLLNRAKPIIYSTSLSLFDIAFAKASLDKILKNSSELNQKVKDRQKLAKDILNIDMDGLILKIELDSSKRALELSKELLELGYIVGAIRPPTVDRAMLRVILRLNHSISKSEELLKLIRDLKK